MKKILVLCLLLCSCTSIHFERPLGMKYLVSAEDGQEPICIVDDERDQKPAWIEPIQACNNVIGVKPDFYQTLYDWFDDKVKRLEICITFPKKCK